MNAGSTRLKATLALADELRDMFFASKGNWLKMAENMLLVFGCCPQCRKSWSLGPIFDLACDSCREEHQKRGGPCSRCGGVGIEFPPQGFVSSMGGEQRLPPCKKCKGVKPNA